MWVFSYYCSVPRLARSCLRSASLAVGHRERCLLVAHLVGVGHLHHYMQQVTFKGSCIHRGERMSWVCQLSVQQVSVSSHAARLGRPRMAW